MYQQELWVYDRETEKIVYKRVSYVPGLYKIFGKYHISINTLHLKIHRITNHLRIDLQSFFQISLTSNWVFAINFEKIKLIEIFVIIDEILVNAADNY